MKKAILAVSFGTTFPDTLEKNIAAIEADLAAAFPDRTLRRAFTSGMVIRRLREREGLEIDNVAQALERLPAQEPGQAVVLMGHGTPHHANAVYAALEYVFRDAGRRDIAIGTVEGYPEFGEICRRLEEMGNVQRVVCLPLMVVAGDHAKNDLAGEEADSWRSMLTARGYQVRCILEGLGENPAIRAIFVRHAKEAAEK